CRRFGTYAGGTWPVSTSWITTRSITAACVCGWTPHYWRGPSRSTRSTARPGPWLLHGKSSHFQFPSTHLADPALGVADRADRGRLQRHGSACAVGLVDRQRLALCPAVRHLAAAERRVGR